MDSCTAVISWLEFFHHKVAYVAVLLTFSAIAVILNLTLISSFIATRQVTKNTSNILIFAISLSDLIIGAVSMPLTASALLNMNADDICIKARVLFCFSGNFHFSIVLTVLLAMDRYLHMNPDFQNQQHSRLRKIFTKRNIYISIMIVVIMFGPIFIIAALHINKQVTLIISTTCTGFLSIYTFILACLYTRGYLRIRHFTDHNPVYSQSNGTTNASPAYVRRLYKTVLIIVLLAFIHYVPLSIIHIIALMSQDAKAIQSSKLFPYTFEFGDLLLNAGCFTNCFVVLHMNTEAKNWVLSKAGKRRIADEN